MYDLIIIGAGSGGYIAAKRAGALGKSVLLVEKAHLGGVCLNQGCIPTKILLHASKLYAGMEMNKKFGVTFENVNFNPNKAMAWKRKVVETLRKGIAHQMKRYNVELIYGNAELVSQDTVRVKNIREVKGIHGVNGAQEEKDTKEEKDVMEVKNDKVFKFRNLIIATGSSPVIPDINGIDINNPYVTTSKGILESTKILEKIPKSLAIIGGGYIGMEFASFFNNLGVQVSMIEEMPEIISFVEPEISSLLRRSVNGVTYYLNSIVQSIKGNSIMFSEKGINNETSCDKTIQADMVLIAVGREPNIQDMGFKAAGIDIGPEGIRVNEFMQTNLPHIYAIGDVTGKSRLAHSASRMGEVAVNVMFCGRDRMQYNAIPWIIYTSPEAAGCGLTQEEACKQGYTVKTAKLPMKASSRYFAEHSNECGVCKVIVDADSEVLLGVHMLGTGCSEVIYGAALMIKNKLRLADIREVVFPHPSVSEILRETILEVN